jgi:hypothetical protein
LCASFDEQAEVKLPISKKNEMTACVMMVQMSALSLMQG